MLCLSSSPRKPHFPQGTTGNPKGACLSHHNVVNNGYFIGKRIKYGDKVGANSRLLHNLFKKSSLYLLL